MSTCVYRFDSIAPLGFHCKFRIVDAVRMVVSTSSADGDDSDRRCFGSPFSSCRRFFLVSRLHRRISGRHLSRRRITRALQRANSLHVAADATNLGRTAGANLMPRASEFDRRFARPLRGFVRTDSSGGRWRPVWREGFRSGGRRCKKSLLPYTCPVPGARRTRPRSEVRRHGGACTLRDGSRLSGRVKKTTRPRGDSRARSVVPRGGGFPITRACRSRSRTPRFPPAATSRSPRRGRRRARVLGPPPRGCPSRGSG